MSTSASSTQLSPNTLSVVSAPVRTCSVLVVGGGIVGLTTAALLAAHGIDVVLVERRPALSQRLRAKFFYARTLEIYRSLGLEAAIQAASLAELGTEAAVVASLAGPELRRWTLPTVAGGVATPCQPSTIKQYDLEVLVKERAQALGAELWFGQELVGLVSGPETAEATVCASTGERRGVQARFVVACDGTRSFVRQQLGVATEGLGNLVYSLGIGVRADLHAALRGRPLAFAYVSQPGLAAYLSWSTDLTQAAISVSYDPRDPAAEARFTPAECHRLAAECLGLAPSAVEVLETYPWRIAAWVAARYRVGRVLLAGDAAHSTPPLGGFGANTGIHDAHNLALKLAAILTRGASDELLDRYEQERRPVAQAVVAQATARLAGRRDVQLPPQALEPLLEEEALTMGYRYELYTPGRVPNPIALHPRQLRAEPGTRAPHVAIERAGQPGSLLDLFGRGLVLLAGAASQPWADQTVQELQQLGVPAHGYVLGRDLHAAAGAFEAAYGVSAQGGVLVRADGFVVWKSAATPVLSPADWRGLLTQVGELASDSGD
jgi:putative polyketide hydroxylase